MTTPRTISASHPAICALMVSMCALAIMSFDSNGVPVTAKDHDKPLQEPDFQNVPDIAPVDYAKVTKVVLYGERADPAPGQRKNHTGIDFEIAKGSDVFATADGVVEFARYGENYGNHVRIKHSDVYSSQYAHLSDAMVKKGDKITKGQVIGVVGNSGLSTSPHLHYEILENGAMVDPKGYLPELPDSKN